MKVSELFEAKKGHTDQQDHETYARLGEATAGKGGMWIIKNKDGKERRFKDDESPEAIAWKNSSSPKKAPKVALYSKEYWEAKEDAGADLLPWTKIRDDYAATDKIEQIVKDQFGDITYDWTIGKMSEKLRDGVPCATADIRVMYEIKPEDDLGVDEPTSDAQGIIVGRNPKNPKKIDFLGFTH